MDRKEVFRKFIEESDVLVVDKNPGSRNRLLKIVCDLGAKRHMVHTASGMVEASNILKEKKINLVLSDYMVAGGSAFDLFALVREQNPGNKELCTVLVTSNISQTAVAKAAEEDVDSFIIKPYTLQSIQENLIATVCAKVNPSDYMRKIEAGKIEMNAANYDTAIAILNEAISMHSKPALALFYIGQCEYMRQYVNEAQGSYQSGLSFNTIHFKCLVGLYELFLREKKFHEAYGIVKKIAKYFPSNPDRLAQVVRLAVQTENYADMQFYYDVFKAMEQRSPALINYIGAGMYVTGKFYLKKNDRSLALQYFDNIAVSCSEYTKFVRAMITLLVEHDMADDAEKYLSRFPAGSKEQEDYLVADFLVTSKKVQEYHAVVKKGLDLYNQKIRDRDCMETLIYAMEKSGYKEEKLADFRHELSTLWPEKAA